MDTHQDRLLRIDFPFDQRNVLLFVDLVLENEGAKLSNVQRQACFGYRSHQHLALHAVMDEVLDGDDLETETVRKFHQLRHSGHRSVVVHDFADDSRRRQAGQAGQINGSLSLTGPFQHAAGPGAQRKHVAGAHEVFGFGLGAYGGQNGSRAVGG